jgi:hypothetical protein
VAFERSLPNLLEQTLNESTTAKVEVLNGGVSGWGTDDQLRYLTEYGLQYEPDLIVVAMTLHNDISDNLREYWHRLEDGALVDQRRTPIPPLEYASLQAKAFLAVRFQLVQLYREVRRGAESRQVGQALNTHVIELFKVPPPDHIERGFELTERLLERMQVVADGVGAPVALVVLPLVYQLSDNAFANFVQTSTVPSNEMSIGLPQETIQAAAERLGMPMIDLLPAFRRWTETRSEPLYIEWDGHWNEEGHRLATQVVSEALLDGGLIP